MESRGPAGVRGMCVSVGHIVGRTVRSEPTTSSLSGPHLSSGGNNGALIPGWAQGVAEGPQQVGWAHGTSCQPSSMVLSPGHRPQAGQCQCVSWVGQSLLRRWSIPAGDTCSPSGTSSVLSFVVFQVRGILVMEGGSGEWEGSSPLQGGRGLRPWCPPWKGQLLLDSAAAVEPATGRGRVCPPPGRAHPCSALGMGAGPLGCSGLVAHLCVIGSLSFFFFFFLLNYFLQQL